MDKKTHLAQGEEDGRDIMFECIRDIYMLFFKPGELAKKYATMTLSQDNVLPEHEQQIWDNSYQNVIEFRNNFIEPCRVYIIVLSVATVAAWVIAQTFGISQPILIALRILSGMLVFVSVFCRLSTVDDLVDEPTEIEKLNTCIWKGLYVSGMGIVAFSFLYELF